MQEETGKGDEMEADQGGLQALVVLGQSTIVSADRQIGAQSNIYYLGADGSSTLGASAPAKLWYLAEGYTGGTFHEYLDVLNPGRAAASVDVRFLPINGGVLKEERSTRPKQDEFWATVVGFDSLHDPALPTRIAPCGHLNDYARHTMQETGVPSISVARRFAREGWSEVRRQSAESAR